MSPYISIIIAAYNRGAYLQETLGAILNSTFSDFEILVIDDHSEENLKQIVDNCYDGRIVYHRQAKNLGCFAAYNRGIISAKASNVMFIGSDDYIGNDYLSTICAIAKKHTEIDYFYTDRYLKIGEHGELLNQYGDYDDFSGENRRKIPQMIFHNASGPVPQGGSLIRKAVFGKFGLYPEKENVQDTVYMAYHAIRLNFMRIDKLNGYFYRIHKGNISRSKTEARCRNFAEALYQMIYLHEPQLLFPDLPTNERNELFYQKVAEVFNGHDQKYGMGVHLHFRNALQRIKEENPLMFKKEAISQERKKIAVIAYNNNLWLLEDILPYWEQFYEVIVLDAQDLNRKKMAAIEDVFAEADLIWIEWMEALAVELSQLPKRGKIIVRLHSFEAYNQYPTQLHWQNIDHLVLVNHHLINILEAQVPGLSSRVKTDVIYNGVNTDKFNFTPKRRGKNIAFAGALRQAKNFPLALYIIKELVKKDADYVLHVAGEYFGAKLHVEELRFFVEHYILDNNLQNNIKMYGKVSDMPAFYRGMDYILSTSIREGMPLNVIEGMSMGLKPVVHNFLGAQHLYPPEYIFNTPEEAVVLILADNCEPPAYRRMVEENYSFKVINPAIKKLIDNTLQGKDEIIRCSSLFLSSSPLEKKEIPELTAALTAKNWLHKERLYAPVFGEVRALKMVKEPQISVVMVSWRFHPNTVRTLTLLNKQREENFEFIFVNNGADDDIFEPYLGYVDTYLKLNTNTGAYLSRNMGALFARGKIIVFLEDDGIAEEGFVKAHRQAHEQYDVISVRGAVFPIDKNNPLNNLPRHYYLGDRPFAIYVDVEGNSSYNAEVFFSVGGWDDAIAFGMGGVELALRLYENYPDYAKQMYTPAAVILHDYAANEEHLAQKREKQQNAKRYIKAKHGNYDTFLEGFKPYFGKEELLKARNELSEKLEAELNYWKNIYVREGHRLQNDFYAELYTSAFDLTQEYYVGKKILDVGCGPRGSLDWAINFADASGLDPLADIYARLYSPNMRLVKGKMEEIPFADGSFDLVSVFCALSETEDLLKAVKELKRILKDRGDLLLISEINGKPSLTNPQSFSWDFLKLFEDDFSVLHLKKYAKTHSDYYRCIADNVPHDENRNEENGILLARLTKRKNLLITVCTPTYNRARFLEETVNSVLPQLGPDSEMVIVDDGSTDNTQEVVAAFDNPHLRYLKKEKEGAPAARNLLIDTARGDYLLWLDSDDILQEGVLNDYKKLIASYPAVDIFYGDLKLFGTLGNYPKTELTYEDYYRNKKPLPGQMLNGNRIPNPGSLVKKELYQKVGKYNSNFVRAHDYDFWVRALDVAQFKHAGRFVANWRWHDGNMSTESVSYDRSYEVKIVKGMLEKYPLEDLFPDLGFGNPALDQKTVLFLTYIDIARIFTHRQGEKEALAYFEKAIVTLAPSNKEFPRENHMRWQNIIETLPKVFAENSDYLKLLKVTISGFLNYRYPTAKEIPTKDNTVSTLVELAAKLKANPGAVGLSRKIIRTATQSLPFLTEAECPAKVSVIIPFYKLLATVEETLQSIFNQTYRNFEIIFVNDGDEEEPIINLLQRVCAKYPEISVHYYAQDNRGLAAARNYGIEKASGKYILPLDADDIIANLYLEKTVEFLENNKEIAFVYTETLFFGTKNEIWSAQDYDPLLLLSRNLMTCTTLYRKSMWLALGGYKQTMKYGYEDWEFWIHAHEKGYRGANLHLPLFMYRRREDSMLAQRPNYDHLAKEQIINNHPQLYKSLKPRELERLKERIGQIPPEFILGGEYYISDFTSSKSRKQENKVLFVCHDFMPYKVAGVQLYAYHLAKNLAKKGYEVDIFHPVDISKREVHENVRRHEIIRSSYDGLNVFQINVDDTAADKLNNHPQFCFYNKEVEWAFRNVLLEEGYALVHYHLLYRLSATLPIISRDMNLPSVMTLHDHWLLCPAGHYIDTNLQLCSGPASTEKCARCLLAFQYEPDAEILNWVEMRKAVVKDSYQHVDKIFCPSNYLAKEHEKYGLKKPEVLPLGWLNVDVKPKNMENDKIIFGFAGRLAHVKGLDTLVSAFKKLIFNNWELHIWGRNDNLQTRDLLYGHQKIKYMGEFAPDNLSEIFSSIDIFMLPSRMENYPLSALEALSAKVPVIARDTGGVSEIVNDKTNGFLYRNEEELLPILNGILQNPQTLKEFSLNPIRSISEDAAYFAELYRELISK